MHRACDAAREQEQVLLTPGPCRSYASQYPIICVALLDSFSLYLTNLPSLRLLPLLILLPLLRRLLPHLPPIPRPPLKQNSQRQTDELHADEREDDPEVVAYS